MASSPSDLPVSEWCRVTGLAFNVTSPYFTQTCPREKGGLLTKKTHSARLLIKYARGWLAPPPGSQKDKYIDGMDPRQWTACIAWGRVWSAALDWDQTRSMMERFTGVSYCFGLLGLLLLQGVLNAEGRSVFSPGKCTKKWPLLKMLHPVTALLKPASLLS